MSLQTRLEAFVAAVGADIKALQAGGTPDKHNISTTQQILSGNADTYLAGSNVLIPLGKIKVGSKYRCKFNAVKTAAGTAAPVLNIRIGTAATTVDSSRNLLTFAAQTAAIDEGVFEIEVLFRQSGASALLQAFGTIGHRLAATGLSTSNNSVIVNTGTAFDVTPANLQMGVSLNVGASSNWTINFVSAELVNLA